MKLLALNTHTLFLLIASLVTVMWASSSLAMPTMANRAIAANASSQVASGQEPAFPYKIADAIKALDEQVALIKANAAEITAMDIATRTVDEGASFSKNDGAALLERDDTGKEAELERRLHIHWARVWEKLGVCSNCGACLWKIDGGAEYCRDNCHDCFYKIPHQSRREESLEE